MREIYKVFVEKKMIRKWLYVFIVVASAFFSTTVQAQLKVGNNPTSINRSSVLELESTNQGFLLPRITDTTLINGLTPPEATMIYFTDPSGTAPGIYIRRTISGVSGWYKLAYNAEDRGWTLGGNLIDPALFPKALLGSINNRSVSFITNNLIRMAIDSLTGKVSIVDSLSVGGALYAKGVATLDSQLVVADTASFAKLVRAQANLTVADTLLSKVAKFSDSLYLMNLKGLSLLSTVLVHDTVTGTVERRNIPEDVFKGWVIGNVDTSSYATALERIIGQNQDADTLIIHGATYSAPGVITIEKQYIAGTKVLRDSLMVGGAAAETPNSTLQVVGSFSINIQQLTTNTTLNQSHYTVIADGGLEITLPSPADVRGRIYIIKGGATTSTSNPVKIIGNIENVVKNAADPLYIFNAGSVHKLQSDGVSSWYMIR